MLIAKARNALIRLQQATAGAPLPQPPFCDATCRIRYTCLLVRRKKKLRRNKHQYFDGTRSAWRKQKLSLCLLAHPALNARAQGPRFIAKRGRFVLPPSGPCQQTPARLLLVCGTGQAAMKRQPLIARCFWATRPITRVNCQRHRASVFKKLSHLMHGPWGLDFGSRNCSNDSCNFSGAFGLSAFRLKRGHAPGASNRCGLGGAQLQGQ